MIEATKDPIQTVLPGVEKDMSEPMQEVLTLSWEDAVKAKAAQQDKQAALLASGPKFISFKGGQLSIDKVPIPSAKLEVVVLTFIAENTYYVGKFDPTKTQMPVCYAVYNELSAMWPAADVAEMQNEDCETCPHYQWGSDPAGGRGKACKTRYRIAVIPAPDEDSTINDILSSELRFATMPVTSSKNLEKFRSKAKLLYERPMFGVTATLAINPDEKSLYIVTLEPTGLVHNELMLPLLKRIEETEKLITYEYSMDEEVEPAKPAKPEKKLK